MIVEHQHVHCPVQQSARMHLGAQRSPYRLITLVDYVEPLFSDIFHG